jgi:predicted transcriptional regulator
VAVQHACEDAQVIETPSEVDQRCSIIRSVTAKALKGQEPVYNVILRRVQSAVRQKVLATSNGQLLRSILERNGLDMVVMQVEKLAAKVALLADWNRTVYATWYDQLLSVHTKE